MTTHDHEDRALCVRLRSARQVIEYGENPFGRAADRIDALRAQREYAIAEIAVRDEIIKTLRAELENQRLSLMATANAVARGRASIEERLNRTRQLIASDATAWHLNNKETDR